MSFEYSKCEPIEDELASKIEEFKFPEYMTEIEHIRGWLEEILNKICKELGIAKVVVKSMPNNSTYLGLYHEGIVMVDYTTLITAKDYIVVGLHELAHHLNEVGSKEYTNEIEYNGKSYRLYHGDGFVKALIKVYSLYYELNKGE